MSEIAGSTTTSSVVLRRVLPLVFILSLLVALKAGSSEQQHSTTRSLQSVPTVEYVKRSFQAASQNIRQLDLDVEPPPEKNVTTPPPATLPPTPTSGFPTMSPTLKPSQSPTANPTSSPTGSLTSGPTRRPTPSPTPSATLSPPVVLPTAGPTTTSSATTGSTPSAILCFVHVTIVFVHWFFFY